MGADMDAITKMQLAKKYAGAFLTEGMDKDSILILAAEMQFIADAFRRDVRVREFFSSPAVPREKRLDAAREFARRGGFSPFTLQFLEILVGKGRGDIIPFAARELHIIADRILNRIRVRMTTAAEPSVTEIEGLSKRISQFFGKNVFVERAIDPSLIGGFILEGGGKLIDMSIRGQIERALLGK
jgi:F-type H+-transporting ATPase subunit delta